MLFCYAKFSAIIRGEERIEKERKGGGMGDLDVILCCVRKWIGIGIGISDWDWDFGFG